MTNKINLNADIAEGFGAYDIGNDGELMKIIKSASVACGFHAGDPNTMHRLVMLASGAIRIDQVVWTPPAGDG